MSVTVESRQAGERSLRGRFFLNKICSQKDQNPKLERGPILVGHTVSQNYFFVHGVFCIVKNFSCVCNTLYILF